MESLTNGDGKYEFTVSFMCVRFLVSAAITMAAQNHALPAGVILHSDRGSNYSS